MAIFYSAFLMELRLSAQRISNTGTNRSGETWHFFGLISHINECRLSRDMPTIAVV